MIYGLQNPHGNTHVCTRLPPHRSPTPHPRQPTQTATWSERRTHSLVEHEQVLDAFSLRREALPAVETIDGAIQPLMRPPNVRRHLVRVVQVGQHRARVGGTSVEHGLDERIERGCVRVRET